MGKILIKYLAEEEVSPEKFDEKKLLPLVATKVVEGEDQRLHELGVGLRHREHQPATNQIRFRPVGCGSGSAIRCLFDPWIWDGYKIRIRIRDKQPGSYFRELRNNFLG